jgi:hypothetical protein
VAARDLFRFAERVDLGLGGRFGPWRTGLAVRRSRKAFDAHGREGGIRRLKAKARDKRDTKREN